MQLTRKEFWELLDGLLILDEDKFENVARLDWRYSLKDKFTLFLDRSDGDSHVLVEYSPPKGFEGIISLADRTMGLETKYRRWLDQWLTCGKYLKRLK